VFSTPATWTVGEVKRMPFSSKAFLIMVPEHELLARRVIMFWRSCSIFAKPFDALYLERLEDVRRDSGSVKSSFPTCLTIFFA
jgi:hypothetical protein